MKPVPIMMFIGLGIASAIVAIVMTTQPQSFTTVAHAGAAVGFGLSFGLCMIAAALVWRQGDK